MSAQIAILYSFRRCPYAMRARMALVASGQPCLLREVVLRDKPTQMLAASAKAKATATATVPVLVMPDGDVIDESLDIMLWALGKNDPAGWLENSDNALSLIAESDGPFKHHLDRYKYGTRYENEDPKKHRAQGEQFLHRLDDLLDCSPFLSGPHLGLADMAIFPFVRQFANTDRQWFDQLELPDLHKWLAARLASDIFHRVMKKYPQWKTGDEEVQFVV